MPIFKNKSDAILAGALITDVYLAAEGDNCGHVWGTEGHPLKRARIPPATSKLIKKAGYKPEDKPIRPLRGFRRKCQNRLNERAMLMGVLRPPRLSDGVRDKSG